MVARLGSKLEGPELPATIRERWQGLRSRWRNLATQSFRWEAHGQVSLRAGPTQRVEAAMGGMRAG